LNGLTGRIQENVSKLCGSKPLQFNGMQREAQGLADRHLVANRRAGKLAGCS
jgi:hypothetical protein